MGVSGPRSSHARWQRGGTPDVMAAVAVDAASFYIAYVIDLAVALAILIWEGHASPLILVVAGLFFVLRHSLIRRCFR